MYKNTILNKADVDNDFLNSNSENRILNNNKSIRIFDNGNKSKPALLFIPMIKEINLIYVPLIKYFKDDFRTIIYEPNLSTVTHYGIADRANEIVNILDTLQIEKVNIVAWSDTCSAAYYFGKQYENRCSSITFLGIADKYKLPEPYNFLTKLLFKYPLEKIIPSKISAFMLSKCLGGSHINYKWLFNKAKHIPEFTKLLKFSIIPHLMEHRPFKNEMNVLCKIICGDRDFLADTERSTAMSILLPNCMGVDIIENAEHFFVYINHEAVSISIKSFLNSGHLEPSSHDI